MRVAIVGGGLAGLVAAHELRVRQPGIDVVVLEGSDRVGGKLRLGEVGGVTVDLGAESMLARRPEALDLVRALGIADRVVHPADVGAAIWTRGALRAMPPSVMGVPSDIDALLASGIVATAPVSHPLPLEDDDVSVADFVRARVGDEVLDRLVEPLLGGVYAGHASRLSLRAAGAQIAALGPDPLTAAVAARAGSLPRGPVFAGLRGGIGQLPDVIARASGAHVRTRATVRSIERTPSGWQLMVGPTNGVELVEADAVIVATPGPASGRLLAGVAPDAAFELAGIEYASMAIVTLALAEPLPVPGTGFLVPPVDGTVIKASTFSSQKWPWLAEQGASIVRASVGRAGETTLLHQRDETVVRLASIDLDSAVGGLPPVLDAHVQRWGGALPQYDVGHLERVEVIERAVASVPGLELCGAAYRGVGIPAVIASARAAAARLLDAGTMGA